ncbi:MAG: ATP-binding protein [bacterium]|nr:ATP-binding protein [bacterium]
MPKSNLINRSIIKKYRKPIWTKFIKAVKDYNLIEENDNIAVCISGGKDSMLMALCFQELQHHSSYKFNCHYIVMNPGYSQEHLKQIQSNAEKFNINIEIFNTNIFEIVNKNEAKGCFLCARMRRGYLYNQAKILGCNKIALGHHFNDVIETVLLNMLYNGQYSGMLPILNSDNFKGLKLIRPLYYIKEEDIISWCKYNRLTFIDCACLITKQKDGKRKYIKELIKEIVHDNKNADINILNATSNINPKTLLGLVNKIDN